MVPEERSGSVSMLPAQEKVSPDSVMPVNE